MEYTAIALIVGVVMGLIKIVERLIEPMVSKKSSLTAKEHEWIYELYKMHARYDDDGLPLWYVPRSWAESQKEIVQALRTVAEDQRRIAEVLDKLDQRYERVNGALIVLKK